MFRMQRTFFRAFLGLILGLAALQPLHAQLDSRLQSSKTDFLDLYQASTNLKAKPEILTVFDFSGSMAALMFHPLYVNTDVSDGGSSGNMSFTISPADANSTYTITATSVQNPNVSAQITVTVGSNTVNTSNTGERSVRYGPSGGRRYLWTGISNISVTPATTITTGATYTFSANISLRGSTDSGGNTSTNLSNVASACGCTFNGGINWTVSGPRASSLTPAATSGGTVGTGATSWTSSAQSTAWIAPASGPAISAHVTATIRGSAVGTLTSTQLIKPDGSVFTSASSDVRDWVRGASHVRFSCNVGSDLRTVDIPIPWKITDRNSTGAPLSSQTVRDTVVKNGVSYGSNTDIEMDQSYGNSLSNDATNTTLNSVIYKYAYIDWLFNGKYANGTYSGKYIVYDAANASLAGGQGNVNWGQGYGPSVAPWGSTMPWPTFNLDGSYKAEVTKDASINVVPALTRTQATKRAAIQTWIKFQKDVFWAFRFLDPGGEASSGNATTINNTNSTNSGSSGWKLLNGSSVTNMNYIAARDTSGSTALTYAMARSLAQYADPSSIFNGQETGADAPSQCMNHFVILFTDGIDNNGTGTNNTNGDTPYLVTDSNTGKVGIDAAAGNRAILANTGLVNRYGTNWNMFTFAGIGAHMADPSLGTVNTDYKAAVNLASGTSGTPSTFLPLAIKRRNGVDFQNDHRVTTMTVGVSLGGNYSDASSPKRSLFLGAALGDPTLTRVADLALLTPFEWVADPSDPGNFPEVGRKKPNSIYFFDATDPDALTTSLGYAIQSAVGASNINTTSNPNLPFVGASLGNEIYIGKFQPPKTGGAVWPGDLLMFGTREVNGQTQIIGKSGDVATVLDNSTAIWATSDALKTTARLWSARKLYTRLPSSTAVESALKVFTDIGADYTDNTTGLKNYVAKSLTAGSAAQQAVIRFAAGGETVKGPFDASNRPTVNRSNLMGDIINSAPAAIEFNWNDVKGRLGSYPRLNAVVAAGGNRFRLILVGTNQGWLHAFGEVTRKTTVKDSNNVDRSIILGDVEELWSFMPTDFLANLDYITVPNNPHRFLVDGTPAIYHLDLPPTGGGYGNGVVDATERAIAIIGLRKGGRSYYALDIHDPFTPAMKWSLVPDEADNFPTSRIVTNGPSITDVKAMLKKWGFSSSTPTIGRITFNGVIRDAVFLGGGFSVPEVEANFPDAASKPTPLGRSVMALDVNTGAVLAAVDMTNSSIGGTAVGPVSAGIIPFEFILNSGMAQRAYFLDYKGGLWSWGSKQVSTATPYVDFRIDTAEITGWNVRKVYQDDNNSASGLGGRYTTLPAPFRVGSFPGVGKPGSASPAAVGVAMVSGDRNNPLDYKYDTVANLAPDHHRLTVVFDRQDSRAWGFDTAGGPDNGIRDTNLMNFSTNNISATPTNFCADSVFQYITPGCPSYYLAPFTAGSPATPLTPKFGYYINFPSIANGFIPKGINPPIVVAGTLFYAYFTPAKADPCTGGSGNTYSWLTTDVKNPIVTDSRSGYSPFSGLKDTWAGVASDFFSVGTRAVLQGGAVSVANPQPGASLTTPEIHTTQGNPSGKYPKPRVWRTVH